MDDADKRIAGLMFNRHGADISMFEADFLQRTMQKRMADKQCNTPEEYFLALEREPNEGEVLLYNLRICYSAFFRNPLTFSVLEQVVLPEILLNKNGLKNKTVRVWSAACAAGQETYSLAMVLEGLSDGEKRKAYHIFGTDNNEEHIALAKQGRYDVHAVRNVTQGQLKKWFVADGDSYSVVPKLKQKVKFSVFDLFDTLHSSPPESIFGGFDIMMCANILFYYRPEFRRVIIEMIKGSLAGNGLVITGETERHILDNAGFREVYPHSAIFRREDV